MLKRLRQMQAAGSALAVTLILSFDTPGLYAAAGSVIILVLLAGFFIVIGKRKSAQYTHALNARSKIKSLIEDHADVLALQCRENSNSTSQNEGSRIVSQAQVKYFTDSIVRPILSKEELLSMGYPLELITSELMEPIVRTRLWEMDKESSYGTRSAETSFQ